MPSCAGVDDVPSDGLEPLAPPAPRKSALAFFGVVLALFLPGLLAQALHVFAGLVWSELFVFLLPALVLTTGSNLRAVPYLRLGRVRPAPVALGALIGAAGTILAMAVMAAAQRVMPRSWDRDVRRREALRPLARRARRARLLATVVAPVCEEIAFRGYLQTTLLARRTRASPSRDRPCCSRSSTSTRSASPRSSCSARSSAGSRGDRARSGRRSRLTRRTTASCRSSRSLPREGHRRWSTLRLAILGAPRARGGGARRRSSPRSGRSRAGRSGRRPPSRSGPSDPSTGSACDASRGLHVAMLVGVQSCSRSLAVRMGALPGAGR